MRWCGRRFRFLFSFFFGFFFSFFVLSRKNKERKKNKLPDPTSWGGGMRSCGLGLHLGTGTVRKGQRCTGDSEKRGMTLRWRWAGPPVVVERIQVVDGKSGVRHWRPTKNSLPSVGRYAGRRG